MPDPPMVEVPPPAEPEPEPHALDDDCDGVDDDGDGIVDENARPIPETCDGTDEDCDGAIDEDFPVGEGCQVVDGVCPRPGTFICGLDGLICEPAVGLGGEDEGDDTCDGLDDDCDGRIDEDPPCNGCANAPAVGPDQVCIPAGQFTRGAVGLLLEEPPHAVALTHDYIIDSREITWAQWQQFHPLSRVTPAAGSCDRRDCPVTRVSWFDAVDFANRRSEMEGFEPCYVLDCEGESASGCDGDSGCFGDFTCRTVQPVPQCDGYRLPTEAEWERAARSHTDARRWCEDPVDAFEVCGDTFEHAVRTGSRVANGFGMFDMLGNVAEWTADGLASYPSPAAAEPLQDPARMVFDFQVDGPREMSVRGSAFGYSSDFCRASFRQGRAPDLRMTWVGLRLVRPLPLAAPDRR